MTTPPEADPYIQLLAISQEVFDAQLYEVAYHALMAALHCADSAQDEDRLIEVATVAQAQRDRLATESPHHLIAPQAAERRGHRSVYDSLLLQVTAMQLRVRSGPVTPN